MRELKEAPKKGPVMTKYADRLGCSTSTLYDRLREVRGKTKDAPGRPREVPRKLVKLVLQVKERGREMGPADAERELATDRCLKIIEQRGLWEGATDHSASRINAIAREEFGYRATPRSRRHEAGYATEVYQMDFSRLEYFQVFDYDDEAGDYLLKNTRNSTAYKDPSGAFRAWVVGLLDDHSRVALARIFATTGESPELGLEFLRWVFSREEDEHPLRYAPEAIQVDAGAFDAKASRRALEAASIELKSGVGKGSQGKVERNFGTLWQRWELALAIEKEEGWTITLRDLNAKLHEHCVRQCREPHPRHRRHTREDVYSASVPGHARTLDADLLSLAFNVRERTVKADGTVPVDNVDYRTPQRTASGVRIEPGDKVRVLESLDGQYKARLVEKAHDEPFDLEAFEPNRRGEYSGPAPTTQETLRDQVDLKQPIGHVLQDSLDDRDLVEAATNGQLEMPDVMPRPESITPESPFAEDAAPNSGTTENDTPGIDPDSLPNESPDPLPEREARRYIGRRLRPKGLTYADVAHFFDEILGQATREDLDEVLDTLFEEVPDEVALAND
jgi:AraC-like DNA-binding protein